MGWRIAGTTVVVTLALAGCGSRELDAGLVASHVKTFEGDDVEVRSCDTDPGDDAVQLEVDARNLVR